MRRITNQGCVDKRNKNTRAATIRRTPVAFCSLNAGARVAAEEFTPLILAEMKRRGSPLPESTEAFVQRLDDYEREYYARERTLNDLDQILTLHRRSGFTVVRCIETDMGVTSPWQQTVAKSVQRRYMIEAECNRSSR